MYRLTRCRENRHAGVQTESRAERIGGRLETTHSAHSCNYSVNDHETIDKILQFHGSLAALESVMCSTCLEQFPSISVNVARLCHCCHLDAGIPKLFLAENNMNPAAVPSELYVSYIHFKFYK